MESFCNRDCAPDRPVCPRSQRPQMLRFRCCSNVLHLTPFSYENALHNVTWLQTTSSPITKSVSHILKDGMQPFVLQHSSAAAVTGSSVWSAPSLGGCLWLRSLTSPSLRPDKGASATLALSHAQCRGLESCLQPIHMPTPPPWQRPQSSWNTLPRKRFQRQRP